MHIVYLKWETIGPMVYERVAPRIVYSKLTDRFIIFGGCPKHTSNYVVEAYDIKNLSIDDGLW